MNYPVKSVFSNTGKGFIFAAFLTIRLFSSGISHETAVIGSIVPEAQPFECALVQFMDERGIPSAAMVITKDGKWWVNRSYGFQDEEKTRPLGETPMFRIASLVKPMTAALIYRLAEADKLELDQPVFRQVDDSGYLKLENFFSCEVPDEVRDRVQKITIRHLLDHQGGWDRAQSGDPVFMSGRISAELGLDLPPTQEEIVRWVLSRPLDFSPGERRAYSNFGYLILGLLIEELTGTDYVEWARQEFSRTCGLEMDEIALARSFPVDRDEREPWYSHPGMGRSIYDSLIQVPYPDGAFHIEIMEAHGGLIVSPQAYMKFLENYWISGQPRDKTSNGQNWIFFGSLPGTYTLGRQRSDGFNIVVFLNQRLDAKYNDYSNIRTLLDKVAESILKNAAE